MIFICFQLLCIIVEKEEDIAAFKDYKPTAADNQLPGGGAEAQAAEEPPPTPKPAPAKAAPPPPPAPTKVAPPPVPAPSPVSQGGRVSATPYAKTLAASKGVDLSVSFQWKLIIEQKIKNEVGAYLKRNHLSSSTFFYGVCVAQSLVFYALLCQSLFVLLSFFFLSLYYLSFKLWLLITPLLSFCL